MLIYGLRQRLGCRALLNDNSPSRSGVPWYSRCRVALHITFQSFFCSLARPVTTGCLPATRRIKGGGSRVWVWLCPTAARGGERRGTFGRGRENSQSLRSGPLLQDVNVGLLKWDLQLFAVWHSHTLVLLKLSQNPVVTASGHVHQPSPRLSICWISEVGFSLSSASKTLWRNSFCY